MSPFNAINKAPNVYIDEIQLPGPIAGVSTSIAAFVGPATKGPLRKATFLTSAEQFANLFGSYIEDPYRVYVTHAVNGFFGEGGKTCHFVRVGTGAAASLEIEDRSGNTARKALLITAKNEGVAGKNIKVEISDSTLATTKFARPTAPINVATAVKDTPTVTIADKVKDLQPGDVVLLSKAPDSESATIVAMKAEDDNSTPPKTTTTLTLEAPLKKDYGAGTIRIANFPIGQQRIRLASVDGIEPGSYLEITQQPVPAPPAVPLKEVGVVRLVDKINNAVTLTDGLKNAYDLSQDVTATTQEFDLKIASGQSQEAFKNLSVDPRHSRFFGDDKIVASELATVEFTDPPTPSKAPKNLPKATAATPLAGGADDALGNIQPPDYVAGINALRTVDNVNLLCVPDAVAERMSAADTQTVQAAMIAHCERKADRFAILDSRADADSAAVTAQREALNSDRGFAALYYPWIRVTNPTGKGRIPVPPSGHVAGVFARTDDTRGVHKAPANESVTSALTLERILTDDEHGPLNEIGVNVVRAFRGRGIKIWGARTIAPQDITQWRYVNVRRLLLFIEKSIQEGTRFAVFEPNNLTLWGQLKRLVTDFLTRVWADGGLFGATPEKAFRVRVDEDLNPPATRALGQVIVEVILYPTTPAEFVVFRIIQEPGGPSITESTQ